MTTIHKTQYVIVGGGPAGLQLAYFLEGAGLDYIVLDGADHVGSFFTDYPRHRKLLSINKWATGRDDPEYNLRHDWNSLVCDNTDLRISKMSQEYFPSADLLVDYLAQFAEVYKLKIHLNRRVERIARSDDDRFVVRCASGERYECRSLVVATGVSRPWIPDLPGIEYATGYESMSVRPEDYENKNVLILGKGNSAFETADNIIPTAAVVHMISPNPVNLAWETRFVGHLRAVNCNFLDTYHLKSQNAVIDGNVEEMWKTDSGKIGVRFSSIHASNETEHIEYDEVLRCTGFRFDTEMFDAACTPALSDCGRLPRMSPAFESENVEGLFFAGTLTQYLDYKQAQSAFIHGFRYNTEALAGILGNRFHGTPFPSTSLPPGAMGMARGLMAHMNRVSSLWQQVDFLADMIVLPKDPEESPRLIGGLPYQYLLDHGPELSDGRDFYISMFRLGRNPPKPHDYERSTNVHDGASSVNIHPVIEMRRGSDGTLISEHHVLEDLLADWEGREYVEACAEYFKRSMRGEELQSKEAPQMRLIVRDEDMRFVDQVS